MSWATLTGMMRAFFRATLVLVLLAGVGYLTYLKLRPVPVASAAAQQKPHPGIPRDAVAPAPVAQPAAPISTNTAAIQQPRDREKLDQEIISRAKAAKLSDLTKGMSDQPFGAWIENNFSGKAKISWETNDCGENDGGGHQDELPVCAEVDLNFPTGEQIGISVAVGSVKVATETYTFDGTGLFNSFFTRDNKNYCSASLDRLAQWANGTQDPPCTPPQ